MPKVPDHFCEYAIVLLQGDTRCADVTRAMNGNLHNERHIAAGRQEGQLIILVVTNHI